METAPQHSAPHSMIGRRAPDFSARSSKGELSMAAFEGSWTMLFCHPASFTPVCTTEFIELARLICRSHVNLGFFKVTGKGAFVTPKSGIPCIGGCMNFLR